MPSASARISRSSTTTTSGGSCGPSSSDLHYDPVTFSERIAERISREKNDLLSAEAFAEVRPARIGDMFDSVVTKVYPEYQRRLRESNAVDFDDLLLDVVQILAENTEIRQELDDRFRYVLVDEYQDTNLAQYQIIAGLSRLSELVRDGRSRPVDLRLAQAGRIENILRFEADYPRAAVIRLEENFRSTKAILTAADLLIAHNVRRKAKTMRTENPEGPPVEVLRFVDAQAERKASRGRLPRPSTRSDPLLRRRHFLPRQRPLAGIRDGPHAAPDFRIRLPAASRFSSGRRSRTCSPTCGSSPIRRIGPLFSAW